MNPILQTTSSADLRKQVRNLVDAKDRTMRIVKEAINHELERRNQTDKVLGRRGELIMTMLMTP